MIGRIINKQLGRKHKMLRRKGLNFSIVTDFQKLQRFWIQKLSKNQLDPDLHFQFATILINEGKAEWALAEYKTACFLGLEAKNEFEQRINKELPVLKSLAHNRYFRLKSLADELNIQVKNQGLNDVKVLDVGGAQGDMAMFLRDYEYCLADPAFNGIDGITLPFKDESFDFVISCHVLEHVPKHDRIAFLDQLVCKSRYGVILLNPIKVDGLPQEDLLKLMIEMFNPGWAREHLECELPAAEFIKSYANEKGLSYKFSPNGTSLLTECLTYLDYFHAKSNDYQNYSRINNFFNSIDFGAFNSEQYPNAGLFYLGKIKS